METINNTPFQFTLLSGKGPGKKVYIVFIIKGTFDLKNNQIAKASDEQLPIFESDQHHGDPAKTSAKAESDFILFKPKTDVVLIGKAYAPGGIPAESCDVSMSINVYKQTIRVFGDRKWIMSGGNLVQSPITKFITMDLIFEKAFGGIDPIDDQKYFEKNPVGKGFYADNNPIPNAENLSLPNLEDPDNPITTIFDKPEPKCFAWYGKSWQDRLAKAGDINELEQYAPDLPPSFDWEFNNGAWPGFIRPYLNGNERITLENCKASGNFQFDLPGIRPQIISDFGFGEEEIRPVLDTVCIMMDAQIKLENKDISIQNQAYLVWRGSIEEDATHKLEKIQKMIIN